MKKKPSPEGLTQNSSSARAYALTERSKRSGSKAAAMIAAWAWRKLREQIKSIAFIVVYLIAVQLLVLRVPLAGAIGVGLGIAATVFGLTLFLEGLFLGIMPLGEQCGLKLPGKTGLIVIMLFSLVLGVTATLAEPAISFLQLQGGSLQVWEKPLLYYLLNDGSTWMIIAIAFGVGLAVVLGVLRFLYGWSFRPFVYILIPLLLIISVPFHTDPNLRAVLGLAWDSGGVTTGPVTVPLIIALGLGISRITSKGRDGAGSLGVITLASALPVLAVCLLALSLQPRIPAADDFSAFFSLEARQQALFASGGEAGLRLAGQQALKAGLWSEAEYQSYFEPQNAGGGSAPDSGEAAIPPAAAATAAAGLVNPTTDTDEVSFAQLLLKKFMAALQTVLPLVVVLLFTLLVILREKIRAADEVVLGLVFTIAGMFFFSVGMEKGLSSLGVQVGRSIPRAYASTSLESERLLIPLERSALFEVHSVSGPRTWFWLQTSPDGQPQAIPFDEARYDSDRKLYDFVPVQKPLFAAWGAWTGYAMTLLFVLVLGIGATLAEPSLRALGATLEEVTTGTYKSATLVYTVAAGVGIGMVAGFGRILLDLPLLWILLPGYLLALLLTLFSSEEFSAIAWDSAGVTTGPVTVPLLIATGLGLGSNAVAGAAFGVVACASLFPVLTVLASGLVRSAAARRAFRSDAARLAATSLQRGGKIL